MYLVIWDDKREYLNKENWYLKLFLNMNLSFEDIMKLPVWELYWCSLKILTHFHLFLSGFLRLAKALISIEYFLIFILLTSCLQYFFLNVFIFMYFLFLLSISGNKPGISSKSRHCPMLCLNITTCRTRSAIEPLSYVFEYRSIVLYLFFLLSSKKYDCAVCQEIIWIIKWWVLPAFPWRQFLEVCMHSKTFANWIRYFVQDYILFFYTRRIYF